MARDDPFKSSEWKRFQSHIRRDLIPKMAGSSTVMILAPEVGEFDIQFAVQIGAAILLEKPLLVLAIAGRQVPPKLEKIADRIIYADGPDDPSVQREIKQFFTDFAKQ